MNNDREMIFKILCPLGFIAGFINIYIFIMAYIYRNPEHSFISLMFTIGMVVFSIFIILYAYSMMKNRLGWFKKK